MISYTGQTDTACCKYYRCTPTHFEEGLVVRADATLQQYRYQPVTDTRSHTCTDAQQQTVTDSKPLLIHETDLEQVPETGIKATLQYDS